VSRRERLNSLHFFFLVSEGNQPCESSQAGTVELKSFFYAVSQFLKEISEMILAFAVIFSPVVKPLLLGGFF